MDKMNKSGVLPKLMVQEMVIKRSDRVNLEKLDQSLNQKLKDVTEVFERVFVDSKETEFICCKTCSKLFAFYASKNNMLVIKKIEIHDCYIKNAPHIRSVKTPKDEKDCFVVHVREPHRIELKEKIKNEPHLYYFFLDGIKTEFAHCTKCLRFFSVSSLNFKEDRIHRCHQPKASDHNIHFKKKLHQCDKCQEHFKSDHFLEIHRRKVHGDGSATVICSHCAKEFPTERVSLTKNNCTISILIFYICFSLPKNMSSRSTIQRSVKSMPVTSVRQHSMTEASSDFTCSSIPQLNLLCVNNVVKDSIGLQAFRYVYKMISLN